MAIEITVPRLGWSMDEGTFVRWLKSPGEPIQPGMPLFELESEKAVQEVEAIDSGYLHIPDDAPAPGQVVPVGAVLAFLLADGESPPSKRHAPETTNLASDPKRAAESPVSTAPKPATLAQPAARHSTPRARRVATELGVDWRTVTGTGQGGRVRERDVRAAVAVVAVSKSFVAPPATTAIASEAKSTALRATIARRMAISRDRTVPVTLTALVDATNLIGLRAQFKSDDHRQTVPTYSDIIAKLVALVLRDHTQLNARWDGDRVVQPNGIHIGVAVDTEQGLLVPVLRDADRLRLKELAERSRELAERARNGTSRPEDLQGGTFTITNLGHLGIDAFTPVINYPETAILGVGAIRRSVQVLDDDRFVARQTLTLSLTFDHQVVDGAPAARFLQTVVRSLETPAARLIDH